MVKPLQAMAKVNKLEQVFIILSPHVVFPVIQKELLKINKKQMPQKENEQQFTEKNTDHF